MADVKVSRMYEVGENILHHLIDGDTELTYAQLGCALALVKLSSPEEVTQDDEIKFVQDIMDWVSIYWGEGPGRKN